jgi:3,4-dihydroxy 2-butanone 4-phosphate synthase/GTP cyclohydrolase II
MAGAQPNSLDDLGRYISPVDEVVADARNGRMFILVDAEHRENEGDLIIPAQFATPDTINFMAKHGRGLICLAITEERGRQLHLEPMSRRNQTRHETAFTVSIEAKEGISTGISAHDRARTISVAIDPTKDSNDIVSPGHVFPLIARGGGVLFRAGHTEASVDIARMAGLIPAAVICEIMNDDGTMARLPDLVGFSQRHGLKIGTIADLIAYRRENERLVDRLLDREIDTASGRFRMTLYRNRLDGAEHVALSRGDVRAERATLVRMHRVDFIGDVVTEAGPRTGLVPRALAELAAEPEGGVLVLIRNLDPDSLAKRYGVKPADPEPEDRMLREYGVGAQILRDLGVRNMVLLSNQPQKIIGLEGYGLSVVGWRAFKETTN